jgi:RNA polymerase-binding transcription factor DksA
MHLGDLTITNLNSWEDSANAVQDILNKWKAQILSTDRTTKKEDLKQLAQIQNQIDAAEKALQSMGWELQKRDHNRKRDHEMHRKLQRYCKALGGDPSLIYWHRDSDFV